MERQTRVRGSRVLLVAGLLCAAVYLVLAVRLPWWRYGGALRSWAQLLGGTPSVWAICLGGVGLLMALYVWGLRSVRRGEAQRRTIWAFGCVFAAALVWLMPITADLFVYLSEAHMLTDLGGNPLVEAPLDYQDPLVQAYPIVYAQSPSVYGPAWALLSAVGTLGKYDMVAGLFYLKALAAAAYLGSAWLIERILRELRPEAALEGLYLFAWNPFVLLMAVGDGHNDIVMMAFALLAVWLLLKDRWALSFGALALSVWFKYVSLALVPLFGLCIWRRWREGRLKDLVRPVVHGGLAVVVVSGAVAAPLVRWDGLVGIVGRLFQPVNWRGESPATVPVILAAGLLLFLLTWCALLVKAWRENGSFQQLVNGSFVALLLVFLLGAVRSQPWHLLWGAALAGLSDYRWAPVALVSLSGLMLAVQVTVEWATPALALW